MNFRYNHSPFSYKRRRTREVKVGDIGVGGNNPIRIQSMITADTRDTENSVRQILELEEAGCEIVRLTVPSQPDADNLPNIRKELKRLGSRIPLVADIHFTPSVAMKSVEWVEKVRINPGNFADKKKFAVRDYSDLEYHEELERIAEVFSPLVCRCKELGVSMRIGTNHGSLSDRIMNRYGDTPMGMVESAIEFIRIAETVGYKDIIVSMKASNPQVMIQAYRLLCSRFLELQMDYPLHLGVTEAGDGKDGRIKSAIGIGSLLEDGLGDTIRVSLTEDPIHEIPVARYLAETYNTKVFPDANGNSYSEFRNPYAYQRFYSKPIQVSSAEIGENHPVRIESVLNFSSSGEFSNILSSLKNFAKNRSLEVELISVPFPADSHQREELLEISKSSPTPIGVILEQHELLFANDLEDLKPFPKITIDPFYHFQNIDALMDFLKLREGRGLTELSVQSYQIESLNGLPEVFKENGIESIAFSIRSPHILHDYRKLARILSDSDYPIVLAGEFETQEAALFESSVGIGGLLVDGIGDLLRIRITDSDPESVLQLGFDLLQATRLRLTKTEYISCPSCGRTLFDLQTTTARIKARTGHLKGVKIAVMGCIVNGPGEMADADFGYVGAGPGKVHLYKGKEIVLKNVPSEEADEKLVQLIKESGMWIERESVEAV
ncbi:putative 4-hydroxy-3-methylbut-2-en-1-yl diphosphate synthase [Leptospira broomii serovar Hurstbridge str. 5399]|uniref:4-hydroxy-3-methylbut-2-en-1-yl diphosphate synthase (flavodoxin) n=1 Tax=Leptospira broomii serovar Hurstbridge str. 5399 TaxID=1049789 RepID=T0GJ13_9LEPT|nr:(E)-4-hydroxy-3-methylbut-2-enyl-diphosphate synthase [Leptospira broomii]EQA46814.1 putative 4-hydroxy-3-methylbut-2-en-1-yl diphosphate synthase [Leptospira broomii serovar Hurstbridge str. 5399]